MKHTFKFVVMVVVLTLLSTLVFAQDEEVPGPGEGGIIVEGYFGSDPVPMNPLVCAETTCQQIAAYMFPALVSVDPETANYREAGPGAMATGWEISEDGLTYTFTLRQDFFWNDGTPVTAKDFVYSWDAIESGELLNTLYVAVPDTVEDMEAPDDYTLVVTLKQPDCQALSNASVPALPSHILPTDFAELNEADFNLNPTVTGGVFKFSSYAPSEQLALEADQNYPASDTVNGYVVPTGYIFKAVPDQTVLLEQFLAGEDINFLDAPNVARRADIRALADAGDVKVYTYPGDFWDYLAFNIADPQKPQNGLDENGDPIPQGYHPIFGNKEVRQALAKAVDIDAIIQAAVFGEGTRMTSYIPASSWAYNAELPPVQYDPEAASAMLDEVGWVDDDNNPETPRVSQGVTLPDGTQVPDGTVMRFTMLGNEGNTRRAAEGQLIQDQLKQIGVEAIYQAVDYATWAEIANSQTFDAIMLAWSESYPSSPDATQLFSPLGDVVGSTNNYPSYYNEEFVKLNEQARTLPGCDSAERKAIYDRMQEIIQDDMPYIWMYSINGMYVADDSLQNFDPRPSNKFWNIDAWYVREPNR